MPLSLSETETLLRESMRKARAMGYTLTRRITIDQGCCCAIGAVAAVHHLPLYGVHSIALHANIDLFEASNIAEGFDEGSVGTHDAGHQLGADLWVYAQELNAIKPESGKCASS